MIQQPRRAAEYADAGTIARIERYDETTDECIIFPASTDDSSESPTKWIVARGSSFVPLDRMR